MHLQAYGLSYSNAQRVVDTATYVILDNVIDSEPVTEDSCI